MATNQVTPTGAGENRILAALPPAERARLVPRLDLMDVEIGRSYQARGEPTTFVYFPVSGLFSLLSTQEDGRTVEVGALGREGFVGLPVLFADEAPAFDTIGQVAGTAWRMRAADLGAELRADGPLRRLLLRCAQAQLTQSGQTAACNRLHEIDLRAARWLLHCADWVGRERFGLTQEFLAYMLGVRRPTVTTAAALLQRAGFITYHRGVIEITDRPGLEGAACGCYALIRDEYRRLIR